MAQLAYVTDLALLLGRPESDPHLDLALRRASSRFAGDVGWPVVQVVDDTVTVYGSGGCRLFLPAMNVTAAMVAGAPDAVLDSRLGFLTLAGGWADGTAYEVTYTHGWHPSEIPGDIQDAVLEQAALVASTLGVFSQENRGALSGAYSVGALGGVTEKWSRAVAKYAVGLGERS